ncbi:hypothetical protein niasHT_038647 [Heterodera trifolii]|uniref:Effector protein n=1 Tax=Heterodera trifolii TaxID=157864 RepID=A0ABD2HS46_9BILA
MRIFLFSAIIFIVLSSALNNGNAQQPPTVHTVRVDGRDYVTSGQHATHFSFRGNNLDINGKCYENHPPPMKRIVSRATDLENEESENRLKEQQSLNKASSSQNTEAAGVCSDDESYFSLSESEDEERNPGTYVYVPASENDQTGDGYHIFVPDEPAQVEISSDEESENEASDSEDEESMPSSQPIMPPAFPTHIQHYFEQVQHRVEGYKQKFAPKIETAEEKTANYMEKIQNHMKKAQNVVKGTGNSRIATITIPAGITIHGHTYIRVKCW